MEIESTATSCDWHSAQLLIFSDNVAPLTYYTHLLPLILSLLLGGFVLYNNRHAFVNRVLFFITLMFALWVYFDLILWASPSPEAVMFFWSIIVPVEMLIYASCLYLVCIFANGQRDISIGHKLGIALFFVPIILFTHTSYNVLGLSPDCDEGAIEGPLIQYMYVVEILYILWAGFIVARGFKKLPTRNESMQLLLIGAGTILFLLTFTAGNLTLIFAFPPNWEQYKLLGMPIFVAFIAYTIVRFKAFNAKLLGAQALVAGLSIAVLSLLFIRTIDNIRIIAGLTFVLVLVLGYNLVRGVQTEIENRERLQKLAKDLEKSNQQQIILIHFVTHQLKGFMTKSRNAFSMLLEGDFGQLPDTMRPIVEEGFRSDTKGVETIQEILNAANIKSGKVTYNKSPLDLKELAEGVANELKPNADLKGLTIHFAVNGDDFTFSGDRLQLMNAIKNLLDNAIKYTSQGNVELSLVREDQAIRLEVRDTGVGITPEDMKVLFTEGGHGKESRKVNAESTGFGLYIVKNIVEAHGGKVWAESEGPGKGSRFCVEIPVS